MAAETGPTINPYESSNVVDAILVEPGTKFADLKWAARGMTVSIVSMLSLLGVGFVLLWLMSYLGFAAGITQHSTVKILIISLLVASGISLVANFIGTVMLAVVPAAVRAKRYMIIALACLLIFAILSFIFGQLTHARLPGRWSVIVALCLGFTAVVCYAWYFVKLSKIIAHPRGTILAKVYLTCSLLYAVVSLSIGGYEPFQNSKKYEMPRNSNRFQQSRVASPLVLNKSSVIELIASVVLISLYFWMLGSVRRAIRLGIAADDWIAKTKIIDNTQHGATILATLIHPNESSIALRPPE